ncbi:MAG: hypothetical protein WD850_03175 [Candidatus Spechtbacterales bacterium]
MTEGDFLAPLLNLSPLVVASVAWAWGFGSLVVVGVKTQTFRRNILKNPAVMVGDVLLLPVSAGLIVLFYQSVQQPLAETAVPAWSIAGGIIASVITATFAVRFQLLNIWWLPHGLFFLFMAYLVVVFSTKGAYQLLLGPSSPSLWLLWTSPLLLIALHHLLGMRFKKRFPTP